ncbi:MAG: hypothetical protein IJD58_07800 [Lachnospiraceae bacterium]|nr:hypothetical protein [Lachnospiraceae bacterium]
MKKKLSLTFLILTIISFVGTITTTIMYFINKSRINDVEFIKIAAKSISKAKELMDKTSMLGWMSIILGGLTVVFMVGTIILFIIWGKEKKMKLINKEATLNE